MNRKRGLEYFPLDIDFFQDEKIQFISARFGIKGESITIRLLCKIYRNGYYIDWNDDMALLFAKSVGDGCQHSFVKDIVYELLKRGFFDRSIFERFSILTSRGIQKRYFEASLRRTEVCYDSRLLLIDISKYRNVKEITENEDTLSQNVNILIENVDILKQSKVKESKVKESNITPLPPLQGENKKTKEENKAKPEEKLKEVWSKHKDALPLVIQDKIQEWIEYKKEKGKGKAYKSQGLNSLLVQVKKKLKIYGKEAVIEVIEESMACNYQGIVWDKLERRTKYDEGRRNNSWNQGTAERIKDSNIRESAGSSYGTVF